MGKVPFNKEKADMCTPAYVDEAEGWARALVRAESRFPGDYGPAMRRLATKAHVSFTLLWRLHYKKPKTIDVGSYVTLGEFYGRYFHSDSKADRFREQRREVTAKTAFGRYLLGVADSLVGEGTEALSDD